MSWDDFKKIMRPWIPVHAAEKDNFCKVSVWGREYTVSGGPLLSSLMPHNMELLAGSMRVLATENGKGTSFEDAKCFLMDEVTAESAAFCYITEVEDLLVDTTRKVEYDGLLPWTLSVMPQGLSVASACGVKEDDVYSCNLSRFWLEIQLKTELFPYFVFVPVNHY